MQGWVDMLIQFDLLRFILIYLQDPDVSLYTLFAAEWHRQCHASQCNLSHWSIGSLEHSPASSRHRSPFLRKNVFDKEHGPALEDLDSKTQPWQKDDNPFTRLTQQSTQQNTLQVARCDSSLLRI